MVVEDLDDLRLVDAGHALSLPAWSTGSRDTDRGDRSERVSSPTGRCRSSTTIRGAVVRILDLLGDSLITHRRWP